MTLTRAAARGQLLIVIAPSGAGKTSLLKAVREVLPDLCVSVSHTTRARRPGELDGVNYHFVDEAGFRALVAAGDFLEHAEVFGNFYGTSRLSVEQALAAGQDVVLEIDWQGARRVRQHYPNAIGIFILPPSSDPIADLLKARGKDEDHVIERRLMAAGSEIAHAPECEYVIINQEFSVALEQLAEIVRT